MPFDQSAILDVSAAPRGADLAVSWVSSAPAGTSWQIYVDRSLAWHGVARSAVLPRPGASARIEVGAVPATEATRDFSASLPAAPGGGSRVRVSWLGGAFLGAEVAGFHVYSGTAPGGAVDYSAPVDRVAAYPQGVVNDGFGAGAFGFGAFGSSAGAYSWTSGPLTAGTWHVGVRPFDPAGNEGTAIEWSAAVAGPPRPVARDAQGRRLTYSFDQTTGTVTLHWLASPGA